jgi:hypothetical protein
MHHAKGQIKMGASNDHPAVEFLKKVSDVVNSVALVVVTVYISMVTFLVLIGIIYRLLGDSLSWSEELSRWLLSGIAFVGASVVLKRGSHVGVVVFIKSLKNKTLAKYTTVITNLLDAGVLLLVRIARGPRRFRAGGRHHPGSHGVCETPPAARLSFHDRSYALLYRRRRDREKRY